MIGCQRREATERLARSNTTKCRWWRIAGSGSNPGDFMSVCLSSVTLVHPTQSQRVELFGNIFAPSNSLGTRDSLCLNSGKKFEGDLGDYAS